VTVLVIVRVRAVMLVGNPMYDKLVSFGTVMRMPLSFQFPEVAAPVTE
jgi:hypothetical protein